MAATTGPAEADVHVGTGRAILEGTIGVPAGATGVILFAHGSGSGRHSPRNRFVAERLREAGLATLLLDLLTPDEEAIDVRTAQYRFDIGQLAGRLVAAVDWLRTNPPTAALPVGTFGASTGAAAALIAAAERPDAVRAVVSRGGRPDLAGPALGRVTVPTLFIVGGNDAPVIGMNHTALAQLGTAERELVTVPGAGHLFEEPGTLEEVARLAADWFTRHLGGP